MAVTAAVLVTADLMVKEVVAALVPPGQGRGPFMSMTNPEFMLGVAGTRAVAMVLLMLMGAVVATVIATRLLQGGRITGSAAGLTVGGALANTIDRALHGAVQDFFVVGHVVVNLADVAVVVGLLLAGITAVRRRRSREPPRV